ncbi:unnamed protein product [Didymodactylos carnosus]|uniref:K Homology domain-containing protein n=1 Tax=Didymodactylos carnosus TaxID=1234261 RepID=A0A813W8X9_9BILA|nr:unnamed protein product [Didymodactylos carnosus]CAF0895707.1 unnamed protein product [Didymodactylos carnosus]CAF3639275.1 unnamed protein product [Didymodactylos carnosus]CAF3677243.1 unnamed protein product [Didymodactylos carnosus]
MAVSTTTTTFFQKTQTLLFRRPSKFVYNYFKNLGLDYKDAFIDTGKKIYAKPLKSIISFSGIYFLIESYRKNPNFNSYKDRLLDIQHSMILTSSLIRNVKSETYLNTIEKLLSQEQLQYKDFYLFSVVFYKNVYVYLLSTYGIYTMAANDYDSYDGDNVGNIIINSNKSAKNNGYVYKNDDDAIPDYDEAFPELVGETRAPGSSLFLSSSAMTNSGKITSSNAKNNNMHTTTSAMINQRSDDDEKRRKFAIHASTSTTRIIEIPPEERLADNPRRNNNQNQNNQRNNAGNNSVGNVFGQSIQKLCTQIEKETTTNITFFYKDQTLVISITGKPNSVRTAQMLILNKLQTRVRLHVNIPPEYHRYIIGTKGTTLQKLENDTLTKIAVPQQDSKSDAIIVTGSKDGARLCEQKILDIYHQQANKGYERLVIPCLYHPWIKHHLQEQLSNELNVIIDIPPSIKQTDEISIRGADREFVEQAKMKIMHYYNEQLKDKIMIFPLDIPKQQHRFILGKKGAGLKLIFDATDVEIKIPPQEEDTLTIQANSVTLVQVDAPRWMHSVVRGDRNVIIDRLKDQYPDVKLFFRDNRIDVEGPPEEVEAVRTQIQKAIDELKLNNTTYEELDIDPQYYKQLIGKNQIRLYELQDETGCDIRFPAFDSNNRIVKLMGSATSVEKAKQLLLDRVVRLVNERTTDVSIEPQYYPQIFGSKKLEEIRQKFHDVRITFPDVNDKSNKVQLRGNKDDVEKCTRYLQQKVKDMYSLDMSVPKKFHRIIIGKGGANIQKIREETDVRIDIPPDDQDSELIKISGKKLDVEKAKKMIETTIQQLNANIENSIDDTITIDRKWHSKFFMRNRELLLDLQRQYGGVNIKFPERNTQNDQIQLHGTKEAIEGVKKRLNELIDTWESTVTCEMLIPQKHYGYLLAQGGYYIQPIQKEHNVQIKFPARRQPQDDQQQETDSQQDLVKFIGRKENVDKAMIDVEKLIPVEDTVEIPHESHNQLIGRQGTNIQTLREQYPDVQISFPPIDSDSNKINLFGPREPLELVKKYLLERYEKYREIRFYIKPEYRSLIIGQRGRTVNGLRTKYDVNIRVPQNDVQPEGENNSENDVVIQGNEDKINACRDEIMTIIKDAESKITMSIDIDPRVHARIIGTGGSKLQQIQKDYNVDIRFSQSNNATVYISGKDQDKIDECIDHLLVLEEDYVGDIPFRQTSSIQQQGEMTFSHQLLEQQHQHPQQADQAATNAITFIGAKKQKRQKQAPFKVKNAPWGSSPNDENENNNNEQQSSPTINGTTQLSTQNGTKISKKDTKNVLDTNDLGEFPTFLNNNNGMSLSTTDEPSNQQQTIVNTIPISWGPPSKRKEKT